MFKILLCALILCGATGLRAEISYNEVFAEGFEVRPGYKLWSQVAGARILEVDPAVATKLASSPLGDKIKIYPQPLILDGANYQKVIVPGTQQRAKALRAFFYDIMHEGRIFAEPEFAKFITRELIELLAQTAHYDYASLREFYKTRSLNDILFMYGPDLLRAKNWVVTEDNVGMLGGLVDAESIEHAFVAAHGLPKSMAFEHPFLTKALQRYLADQDIAIEQTAALFDTAWLTDNFKGALPLSEDEMFRHAWKLDNEWLNQADGEINRLAELLNNMHMPIVRLNSAGRLSGELPLRIFNRELRFVFERATPDDWSTFAKYRSALQVNEDIKIFPSPGTNLLSNKILLPYVEGFVRFYLKEEPILKSAATLAFHSAHHVLQFAKKLHDSVEASAALPPYVVKFPDGEQGSNVYVTSKMTPEQLKYLGGILNARGLLLNTVGNNKVGAPLVVQMEVAGSHIPSAPGSWLNLQTEIRPITTVLGDQISVRERPWGRGSFALGHHYNNVSQGAFEVVTFLDSDCAQALNSAQK